jgi:hypothetical protein
MKKNNIKTSILTVLFLASLMIANAGSPNKGAIVKGQITDKTTNQPAPFSSIVLTNAENNSIAYGTLADENGKFNIKNIPYGRYNLTVYMIGYYKKYIFDVELSKSNKHLKLNNIKLDQNANEKYDVEIVGKRTGKYDVIGYKEFINSYLKNNYL